MFEITAAKGNQGKSFEKELKEMVKIFKDDIDTVSLSTETMTLKAAGVCNSNI